MSNYYSPEFTPKVIVEYLADFEVAMVNPEDIDRPTFDSVCFIYGSLMTFLDPSRVEDTNQVDFGALDGLENPEYHVDSIQIINFYDKVKDMLSLMGVKFVLTDLVRPDRARTKAILSTVINFLIYRNDKLAKLQPIADQCNDERRKELESRISELKKEISEHKAVREQELPSVKEIEAEVRDLKQRIQERNKEQMSLKTHFKRFKENIDAINDKTSQADFELLGNAQENSKLSASIVQSPEKLQKALEEKKTKRAEVKNAERSAMLSVQSKTATLEDYTKACEKITKHFSKLQNFQEQLNATKIAEKEVKTLKAKISDEDLAFVSLDSEINELDDKSKQAEDLIKGMEKERDLRIAEQTQKLNNVKSETEQKNGQLNQMEEKTKAEFPKGEILLLDAASVREAGNQKHMELLAETEKIVNAFRCYSAHVDPYFERIKAEEDDVDPLYHDTESGK